MYIWFILFPYVSKSKKCKIAIFGEWQHCCFILKRPWSDHVNGTRLSCENEKQKQGKHFHRLRNRIPVSAKINFSTFFFAESFYFIHVEQETWQRPWTVARKCDFVMLKKIFNIKILVIIILVTLMQFYSASNKQHQIQSSKLSKSDKVKCEKNNQSRLKIEFNRKIN